MTERTVVITGASDGIGAAAARQLKAMGARVIVVGRSPAKTESIADELDAPFYLADFTKLDDVRLLAARLRADLPRIEVLAHNAGGVMGAPHITVDGNEMTLQVNHLAPFLLTRLLLDTLTASRASVITTSSIASRGAGTLNLEDINLETSYTPQLAYSRTKLMNLLFTKELHRRFHPEGIATAAFHPGIVRTAFATEFPGSWTFVYTSVVRHLLRSPAKGGETLVWLASASPERDWTSGEFYKDTKPWRTSPQAADTKLANDLWELSATLTDPA